MIAEWFANMNIQNRQEGLFRQRPADHLNMFEQIQGGSRDPEVSDTFEQVQRGQFWDRADPM